MLAGEAGRPAFDSRGDLGIGDDGSANQEDTEGKLGKEVREVNQKEANTVKHLALGNNKVLERLSIECPECKGKMFTFARKKNPHEDYDCPICYNGKIKWKWTPQVGEWCMNRDKKVGLIVKYWPPNSMDANESMEVVYELDNGIEELVDEFTPILEWETIQEVLKKAGYHLKIMEGLVDIAAGGIVNYTSFINLDGKDILDRPFQANGKTRQEAVMLVVLALGKEIKTCD